MRKGLSKGFKMIIEQSKKKEEARNNACLYELTSMAKPSQFSATELGELLDMAIVSLRQTVIMQLKVSPNTT